MDEFDQSRHDQSIPTEIFRGQALGNPSCELHALGVIIFRIVPASDDIVKIGTTPLSIMFLNLFDFIIAC
jgi:hypothetical protein